MINFVIQCAMFGNKRFLKRIIKIKIQYEDEDRIGLEEYSIRKKSKSVAHWFVELKIKRKKNQVDVQWIKRGLIDIIQIQPNQTSKQTNKQIT